MAKDLITFEDLKRAFAFTDREHIHINNDFEGLF